MNKNFKDYNSFKLVNIVISNSDGSFKEKPYARLKDNYKVNSSKINAENYLIESCERRGIWPIELLLDQFCKEELSYKISYITDCGDRSKFDPPRKLSELRTEKCAYFAGVAAGDGGFNGPKTWSVVDGGKEHQLEDSRKFIENISQLMQDIFGFEKKSIWINKRDNRIELKLTNKWFSRYIRHVFGLPKSYKKGKLSRPDIFQSEENIAAFWRGVFDTDGSVSSQSNRVSSASATENFIDQAIDDLESLGLEIYSKRELNDVHHIRITGSDFEIFCNKVGFAHPRKKRYIFSKLRNGSRTYIYKGRDENMVKSCFYDLTKLEDLRVIGLGKWIKKYRAQRDLYQKELAEELKVSRNQVYNWENENNFASVNRLSHIFESKKEFLQKLSDTDTRFKVGIRGNINSEIRLPVETKEKMDDIASKIISTKNELRIKNKDRAVASEIERYFDTEVIQNKNKFYVSNWTVIRFFSTFYRYDPKFSEYEDEEINQLDKKLSILN